MFIDVYLTFAKQCDDIVSFIRWKGAIKLTGFYRDYEIVWLCQNYLSVSQKTESTLLTERSSFSSQKCVGKYLVQKH